ncbi:MAG: UPF0182 family protein, partial [Actinobacteria bacterium]|nr:UPF0182 family protein [Actinomycetota bacterium]
MCKARGTATPTHGGSVTSADNVPPRMPQRPARPPARRGALGPTIVVLLILAGSLSAIAEVWTDVLWYDQLGFTRVFWTEWIARLALFALGFLLMGSLVGLSTLLAYRARRAYVPLSGPDRNLEVYRQQVAPIRRLVFWAIVAVSGLFMGATLAAQWRTVLLWFNAEPFGVTDPQFGLDVSFFVFTLPFLRLILSALMWTASLALVVAVAVHYLYGAISISPRFSMARPARVHVAVL